jgi:hypothetical protein
MQGKACGLTDPIDWSIHRIYTGYGGERCVRGKTPLKRERAVNLRGKQPVFGLLQYMYSTSGRESGEVYATLRRRS